MLTSPVMATKGPHAPVLLAWEAIPAETQGGHRSCEDFLHFMGERAKLEESYARALNKLGRHALGVAETGALKTLFEKLKSDLCNEAHQHEIMAESIRMDVIEPVHRVIEEYREVSAVVDRVQVSLNDLRAGYEKCVSAYHKYTLQLRECRGMRTAAGLEPPIPFVLDLRKDDVFGSTELGERSEVDRHASIGSEGEAGVDIAATVKSGRSLVTSFVGIFKSSEKATPATNLAHADALLLQSQQESKACMAKYTSRKIEFNAMVNTLKLLCDQHEQKRFGELVDAIRRYVVCEASAFANCQYDTQQLMKCVDELSPAGPEGDVDRSVTSSQGQPQPSPRASPPPPHIVDLCVQLLFMNVAGVGTMTVGEAWAACGIAPPDDNAPPPAVSLEAFATTPSPNPEPGLLAAALEVDGDGAGGSAAVSAEGPAVTTDVVHVDLAAFVGRLREHPHPSRNLLGEVRKHIRSSPDGLPRFVKALSTHTRAQRVVPTRAGFDVLGSLMLIALDVADQRSDYERARLLLVASQVVYFQKEAPVGDGTSVPTFSLSDFLGATTPPPPTPPTLPPPALPSPGQEFRRRSSSAFLMQSAMNPAGVDERHPDRMLLQSLVKNHRVFQSVQFWESAIFDAIRKRTDGENMLEGPDDAAPAGSPADISCAQLALFGENMLRFGVPMEGVVALITKFAQFVGLGKDDLGALLASIQDGASPS